LELWLLTKLILDKEGKFLLASALSAIFKVHQNNKKKKTVSQIFPSTHLPSFIQISSAVSEKQVRDGRTAARQYTSENNKLSLLRLTT
jgi:cyclopropane fatty-acyl-phospholipid synthase-like methyltransferase